jgi:L-aminopeptidase/D-esterase-like protein
MCSHMNLSGTLTDVAGLTVGHYTDAEAATGCTVVLCGEEGAVAGVDVRGAAPGTRETDLLSPVNLIERVHAVLLTGGSAFGLDAAGGVMSWLEERHLGCEIGACRVPLVCAAVLFDLAVGRADVRPDAAAGHAACEVASTAAVQRGSVGAGTGATVGKLQGMARATKGGLGSASTRLGDGVVVAALVALNAGGNILAPDGRIVAGVRDPSGGFVDGTAWLAENGLYERARRRGVPRSGGGTAPGDDESPSELPAVGGNTTLAVVATDAVLTKTGVTKVAQMAHDGLARAIDPVHTMYDGDTVFALATGEAGRIADVSVVGAVAARVVSAAVVDAVRSATGLAGVPAIAELARRGSR